MTYTEKYLSPHEFFKDLTFEEFCEAIPNFYFKNTVPNDVIKNYEVIEQLLAHSYFEYRLIDEAVSKALHTFEMAMNMRLNELTKSVRNLRYTRLINELNKLDQFESDRKTLEYLKFSRDYYSHPKRHSYGGSFVWNRVEQINHLVNEMYEDVNLRKERIKLKDNFNRNQQNLKLKNHLVYTNDSKRIILYQLQLLFIDNKANPHQYHFGYTPLFDLESKSDSEIKVPIVYEITLTNPLFENNTLIAKIPNSNSKVNFSLIESHNELKSKFLKWDERYNRYTSKIQKWMYDDGINNYCRGIYFNSFGDFLKK